MKSGAHSRARKGIKLKKFPELMFCVIIDACFWCAYHSVGSSNWIFQCVVVHTHKLGDLCS
jgi:hypothetical protein